jgi:hypothetical protein
VKASLKVANSSDVSDSSIFFLSVSLKAVIASETAENETEIHISWIVRSLLCSAGDVIMPFNSECIHSWLGK